MKKTALIISILCIFTGAISAADKPSTESNVIAVTGEGEVEIKPDVAVVDFSVNTVNMKAQNAYDENNALAEKIKSALKGGGIKEEDLKTISFNMHPDYEYMPQGRKREFKGHRVSHRLTVKIRDISKAGKILDVLVESGANEVSGISFVLDDTKPVEKIARQKAIEDARQRAESLAAASAVTLGKIIKIEEQGLPGFTPTIHRPMALSAEGAGSPVEPGQLNVYTNVNVWFAIEPAAVQGAPK